MVYQSSKRILEILLVFLMVLPFVLNGTTSVLANEVITLHKSKLLIEKASCSALSRIKGIMTNIDHNSRLRVVDYPNIFEVTYHSSIHRDTVVSVLNNAGYPTKILSTQKTISQYFKKVKYKEKKTTQIHLPRRTCNATSATWKELIRRIHNEWYTKTRS